MASVARTHAVFRALSDPTRRAMLDRLRGQPCTASELGAPFAISQPAISQHLRVLESAGLVGVRRSGRERVYRLEAKPLMLAFQWLEHFETFWTQRLDALGAYLDEAAARTKKRTHP